MPSGNPRRTGDPLARLRRAKVLVLGGQIALILGLAGYFLSGQGVSLDPLRVPLNPVLPLLLVGGLAVALQALVFRGLEIKRAVREGQRYLLAERSWQRAKRAAAAGLVVVLLLLTPPVQATALHLISPQGQRSLDVGGAYPLRFPSHDPLSVTEASLLWVAVQNGALRVTVRDGDAVLTPGGVNLTGGQETTLTLPGDRFAVYEATFANAGNATTTFTYRVRVDLAPSLVRLAVFVALAVVVANLGFLAYLRPRRAVRRAHEPPAGGWTTANPQGTGARPWYEQRNVWTPVYSPWTPFPPRSPSAPSSSPSPATTTVQEKELPPPPPQVDPYEVEAPPPPPDEPLPDPQRALIQEVAADLTALMAKAEDRMAAGDFQEALEDFTTILHFDRGNLRALLKKAELLDRLQRSSEALAALEEVLRLDPWHQEALLRKGALLERDGRDDAALECYEAILRGGPAYVRSLVRKGDILARAGEAELAWEAYTDALRLAPDDPELQAKMEALEVEGADALERARREMERGDRTAAETWYRRAMEGDDRPDAIRELADLYLEEDRVQEALPLLDEAILETPRDVALQLRRAWTLAELGQLAEALDACEGACELAPSDPEAWALKGDLEARLDLRDKARETLRRARELNPEDPGVAALLERLDRRAREEEQLREALWEVDGMTEEAAAAIATAYRTERELKRAKVRSLAEDPAVPEDLAKRVLKHVRRRR